VTPEQNGPVLFATSLRSFGPERLAELLRRRPELLAPAPPGSFAELVARLRHPALILTAVQRLDLPTLQVAEVLAALGDRADRASLLALMGIGSDDERVPAVDRALATLREQVLTEPGPGCRPLPELRELWGTPLGLAEGVEILAGTCTADRLREVIRQHGEPPANRKADLIARVVAILSDPDRVRALVARAPRALAGQLLDHAHGRTTKEY
jgi:hypothetical protein